MGEPYCGPAPTPQLLASAWNFDIVALLLAGSLLAVHLRCRRETGRRALILAIGLLLLLFLSPLCALATSLFSARVVHHVLLIAVVAPMLAVAFPARCPAAMRWPLSASVACHAIVLWFWHAPGVYSASVYDALPYWLMQGSLLASAFAMWRGIFASRELGPALLALLATVLQMGMLGALLTFASRPLYSPHFLTTDAFGLSPLDDQRLAGLIMWVPAALPYLVAALLLVSGRVAGSERTVPR